MASNPPAGSLPVTPEPRLPAIILTFEAPGAAGFRVSAEGVTPAQLYAAAKYLDELASATWQGELRRTAMSGLVPASPGALGALRGGGHG